MKFLAHLSTRTSATVVIQTNGVLLDAPKVAEIKSWERLPANLARRGLVRGELVPLADARVAREDVAQNLRGPSHAGIPTEIYCVLNDRSLPFLEDTLRGLRRYEGHVVIHPFPVRGR